MAPDDVFSLSLARSHARVPPSNPVASKNAKGGCSAHALLYFNIQHTYLPKWNRLQDERLAITDKLLVCG